MEKLSNNSLFKIVSNFRWILLICLCVSTNAFSQDDEYYELPEVTVEDNYVSFGECGADWDAEYWGTDTSSITVSDWNTFYTGVQSMYPDGYNPFYMLAPSIQNSIETATNQFLSTDKIGSLNMDGTKTNLMIPKDTKAAVVGVPQGSKIFGSSKAGAFGGDNALNLAIATKSGIVKVNYTMGKLDGNDGNLSQSNGKVNSIEFFSGEVFEGAKSSADKEGDKGGSAPFTQGNGLSVNYTLPTTANPTGTVNPTLTTNNFSTSLNFNPSSGPTPTSMTGTINLVGSTTGLNSNGNPVSSLNLSFTAPPSNLSSGTINLNFETKF
jgi:hypothetical protein